MSLGLIRLLCLFTDKQKQEWTRKKNRETQLAVVHVASKWPWKSPASCSSLLRCGFAWQCVCTRVSYHVARPLEIGIRLIITGEEPLSAVAVSVWFMVYCRRNQAASESYWDLTRRTSLTRPCTVEQSRAQTVRKSRIYDPVVSVTWLKSV